ncbi:golgin subfamily A member 6-like protein 22 isoform X1 [Mercenaria mercenaria]|uniref:golgin subfamily A member 6-like protein 22 isoform X1 n=1 Tax=Mercenaria mercenaria TaxID=6596 RepID=UPI00234F824A|nr:golgin subfamily A member 6-like protein 22 isoform X1 [Mercenaria mercenaria]
MIDDEDINFIKVFLIIMKGGTFVCRKLVLALVAKSGKSLEDILQGNRQVFTDKFLHGHLTDKNIKKLFPIDNKNIDINQWDISLLTFFLLNVFSELFQSQEIAAINVIRVERNNVVVHSSYSKITNDEFESIWPHVTKAMGQLSRLLTRSDQIEYNKIEVRIRDQPFQTDIIKLLEEIELTDTLTERLVNCIVPMFIQNIIIEHDNNRRRNEVIIQLLEQIGDMIKGRLLADERNLQDMYEKQIAPLLKMQVNTKSGMSRGQVQELTDLFQGMGKKGNEEIPQLLEQIDIIKGRLLADEKNQQDMNVNQIVLLLQMQVNTKSGKSRSQVQELKLEASNNVISNGPDVDSSNDEVVSTITDQFHGLGKKDKEFGDVAVDQTLECSEAVVVRNKVFGSGKSTNTLHKVSDARLLTDGEKVELHAGIDIENAKLLEDYQTKEITSVQTEKEMNQYLIINYQNDEESKKIDDAGEGLSDAIERQTNKKDKKEHEKVEAEEQKRQKVETLKKEEDRSQKIKQQKEHTTREKEKRKWQEEERQEMLEVSLEGRKQRAKLLEDYQTKEITSVQTEKEMNQYLIINYQNDEESKKIDDAGEGLSDAIERQTNKKDKKEHEKVGAEEQKRQKVETLKREEEDRSQKIKRQREHTTREEEKRKWKEEERQEMLKVSLEGRKQRAVCISATAGGAVGAAMGAPLGPLGVVVGGIIGALVAPYIGRNVNSK